MLVNTLSPICLNSLAIVCLNEWNVFLFFSSLVNALSLWILNHLDGYLP